MTQQTVVAPPPTAPASYEFSKTENATISRTATWAKALSVMFFVSTAVQVFNLNILGILVDLAIGVTFWKGATLLDSVVNTEDDDVPNMLGALGQLQTAFTIRIIITAVAAAIGLMVSVGFFIQYEFIEEAVEETPAVTVEDADADEEDADEEDADEEDADEDEDEEAEEEDAPDAAPADPSDSAAADSAPPDAPAADSAAEAVPAEDPEPAEGAEPAPAEGAAPAAEGDTPPA